MSTSLSNSNYPNALQAPANSLMGNIAGAAVHLKAIANQLEDIQNDYVFVLDLLKNPDWSVWGDKYKNGHLTNREEASKRLTSSVVRLQSALDAIAVMDNNIRPKKDRIAFQKVSFWKTDLTLHTARNLQVYLRTKASRKRDIDSFYLDFNSLANFWKHYYPSLLEPQDNHPHRDFFLSVHFCSNNIEHKGSSGPILHDLLVPALRVALGLVFLYAGHFNVPEAEIPGMNVAII